MDGSPHNPTLPAHDTALVPQAGGGKMVRNSGVQHCILLSPMYGPKSVLLSPMLDKSDGQSRFVILPMEAVDNIATPRGFSRSPQLALKDFTCGLDAEVQDTLRLRAEAEAERDEPYTDTHRTQDRQAPRSHSDTAAHSMASASNSLSLQPNNLTSGVRNQGALPRDHHASDLLYNNKVRIKSLIIQILRKTNKQCLL